MMRTKSTNKRSQLFDELCFKKVTSKQLMDEVFVMSGITKVEKSVISRAEGWGSAC